MLSWGPSETGEVDMGGNMVRYYTSSYTGIDVQPVDLTSYDMMHIDFGLKMEVLLSKTCRFLR